MKTLITAVLGSFGGAALGIALSLPFMHFIPMCGEDCAARRLELLLSCALVGAILVFATCLALQVKRSRTAVWTVTLGAELIINLVGATGGLAYAKQKAEEYSESARNVIASLPESAAKKSLMDFSRFVIEREK